MTAMQNEGAATPPKKRAKKTGKSVVTDTRVQDDLLAGDDDVADEQDAQPKLKVVKPKPKPGAKGFDWQDEYPGEDVFVYTVPEGTKSPAGLTVGLTRLGLTRQPKPGLLRRLHREGGLSVMWYFVELASSPASLKLQELLEPDEYNGMLRAWAEFAGIELSE